MDLRTLSGIGPGTASLARPAAKAAAGAPSFTKALDTALKTVSKAQEDSSSLQSRYINGAPDVSLEDTMVKMQQAQVSFQAALTVRNRLVSAYTDIMNMQV